MKSFTQIIALATLALGFSGLANADLLTVTQGKEVKGKVTISVSAKANVNGQTYDLTTVGSGIRKKTVVFTVDVYVAELMLADADKGNLVKTDNGALPSLDNVKQVAMRLNWAVNVPADKIITSFQEGFHDNNISLKDPDVMKFMDAVAKAGNGASGGAMNIVLIKNADGTETVALENTRGPKPAIINGSRGFTTKVMALWLGTSKDAFLTALKAELLK
jgi:hypothetical protein